MQYTFTVQGMTCGHCEAAVARAIKTIDPLATVAIDRAADRVEVQSSATAEALTAAIADEGYAVAKTGG